MLRAAIILPLAHGLLLAIVTGIRVDGNGLVSGMLALVAEFRAFLLVPLPLWLLSAALTRTRWTAAAAALPWLFFASVYGAQLRASGPVEAGGSLRVMTFNLGWDNSQGGRIATVIRQAMPDVVIVQELGTSVAATLAAELGATHPHQRLRPAEGYGGRGVFSRYAVLHEETWDEQAPNSRAQYATLTIDGRTLHLVNLHLLPPQPRIAGHLGGAPVVIGLSTIERRAGSREVLSRLSGLATGLDPVIVGGDLNMSEGAADYALLLSAGFSDGHARAGRGFGWTFPASPVSRILGVPIPPGPVVRIDHLLYSRHLSAESAAVLPESAGSDHRPLLADFHFAGP